MTAPDEPHQRVTTLHDYSRLNYLGTRQSYSFSACLPGEDPTAGIWMAWRDLEGREY